jgi:type IV pilus assembly protein PilM
LQGLGLARLSPNLIGRRSSLLDRFTSRRGLSPLKSVWGIDLGTTGIKAIELTRDKPGGTPRVTNVASVRHSASLIGVSASESVVQITQESVRSLLEQISTTRGKAVISFSGPKSLGRYFEIPKLKGSKLVDAVTYEARMQIPVPIEEIDFDWHAWDNDESSRFVGITLLAARKDQIDETLRAFEGVPIKPIAIQSSCLALYNAAFYEFWRGQEQDVEDVAMLDVGTESSTLIVGSPTQVRYRSLAIGTEKMNRYLMTRFNLTRDKAEATRERWSGCRWMYQVDEELVPLYREMSSEVRRTLAAYENEDIRVQELLVTGGGARQYGLLRDFVFGDFDRHQTTLLE